MSRLSRSALFTWVAAVAVAAIPAWELWRERLDAEELVRTHGEPTIYGLVCLYSAGPTLSPLTSLGRDLDVVIEVTAGWAVPALVVLVGLLACLGHRDPATTGRRVAGLLIFVAVVEPLVSLYRAPGECGGMISLLSADWFRAVAGAWGLNQVCLLTAAGLVLGASRATRPSREQERVPSPAGTAWRRPAAFLVDYLIVSVVLGVVVGPLWSEIGLGSGFRMGYGLLGRVDVFGSGVRPAESAVLSGLFLYFWVQHALWGRTLGKRLMKVRVVAARTGGRLGAGKAVLRTLAFPLLAFVPGVGLLCILVDGLWMLLDPEGRVLHDRWLGAAVVRDGRKQALPQA
ncbi:RDD family protein [Nonomuraea sp. LPB2021202275-12-8]|uniref:RDD family protein n=1 Tax=Nonomuraea sp. LPB2021202275-12-8 TaxID=3120159 RepID=UPI00300D0AF3